MDWAAKGFCAADTGAALREAAMADPRARVKAVLFVDMFDSN
jgi:hypothetical protein